MQKSKGENVCPWEDARVYADISSCQDSIRMREEDVCVPNCHVVTYEVYHHWGQLEEI